MSDVKVPSRLMEVHDMAVEARVTPAAVRLSLRTMGISPDYITSRSALYSPATVQEWREKRRARGLAA
jgi:hypothetical protein